MYSTSGSFCPPTEGDGRLEVVEVVQVILPLLVDHREHDEAHDLFGMLAEEIDLVVERLPQSVDDPGLDFVPLVLVLGLLALVIFTGQASTPFIYTLW